MVKCLPLLTHMDHFYGKGPVLSACGEIHLCRCSTKPPRHALRYVRSEMTKYRAALTCYLCHLSADSGLVVPSVPYELHKRLLAAAEHWGLSVERRLETTGVCSSQMALTLLGGPNR